MVRACSGLNSTGLIQYALFYILPGFFMLISLKFHKIMKKGAGHKRFFIHLCDSPLKMTAADGKKRLTDVADTEQLLRIIQSIPSPKAEPFKMWLAQVGRERIEETIDPELIVDRAHATYLKKGYTCEWINQRLQAIQVRKELTDEWDDRGVQKNVRTPSCIWLLPNTYKN